MSEPLARRSVVHRSRRDRVGFVYRQGHQLDVALGPRRDAIVKVAHHVVSSDAETLAVGWNKVTQMRSLGRQMNLLLVPQVCA